MRLIFVFQFRHHFKRVTRNLRKPELVSLPPNDKLCFLGAIIPSHSLYQEQKKKQRIISTELYNQNYAWSSELPQIKKRHNLYEHQTVITPFQIFWISQCMANPPPHIWLEVFHFTILILFFNGKIISLRKSRLLNGNEHLLSVSWKINICILLNYLQEYFYKLDPVAPILPKAVMPWAQGKRHHYWQESNGPNPSKFSVIYSATLAKQPVQSDELTSRWRKTTKGVEAQREEKTEQEQNELKQVPFVC